VAEFPTDNICYTTPLFAHGRLFCGSGDRHLYVIDLDTMSLARKLDCRARVYSSPRLIADSVISARPAASSARWIRYRWRSPDADRAGCGDQCGGVNARRHEVICGDVCE